MLRGMIASGLVFATAIESVGAEPDLVKYAITQGGLLAVVLVLLWSYRRDFLRIQQRDEEKIAILTSLVSTSSESMVRSAEATHRLAKAVEHLDERRSSQRGGSHT